MWINWLSVLYSVKTNLWVILCLYIDSAGAARSDPVARWSDSSAAGPAGSAPADHYPAAADSYNCWTEPGIKFWPVEQQIHYTNPLLLCVLNVLFPYLWPHRGSRLPCRANRWHRQLMDRPLSTSLSMQMVQFCSKVNPNFSSFLCLPCVLKTL